ncbi:MAG: hypothetical protein ACREOR_11635 [Candidatus Binatia bacterium]
MISLVRFKRIFYLLGALLGLLFPARGGAQPHCVELTNAIGVRRNLPAALGSALRLSFRHSIFGSQVEEVFALRREGFQLTQLRYGEARLVDFYGHEQARLENGVWIVTPTPTLLPSLNLHLSADAVMSLRLDRSADAKQLVIQPGDALRVTVAACKKSADD